MEFSTQQTSSIDAAWPPSAAAFERIRGFYTDGTITSRAEADSLAEVVFDTVDRMEQSDEATRVSFRAVAEIGSIGMLQFNGLTQVEAILPIAGTDLGLVYFGKNHSSRSMDPSYIRRHAQLIQSASQRRPLNQQASYDLRIVDNSEVTELVEQFTPLYEAFGYNAADTDQLLRSESNTVAYIMSDEKVVSTAMAEHASIPIVGFGDLNITEITEASTHPDYRRRGLYARVSGFLLDCLIARRDDDQSRADIIYGESNLAMPGVVYAAQENGRRFCYFDRETYGIGDEAYGILPQNFRVEDGVETRPYNDFAVSYVPLVRSR